MAIEMAVNTHPSLPAADNGTDIAALHAGQAKRIVAYRIGGAWDGGEIKIRRPASACNSKTDAAGTKSDGRTKGRSCERHRAGFHPGGP